VAHFETTIETEAPLADAFRYVADFSNTQRWDPTVSRASRLTTGPLREGARFEVFLMILGRELRFDYRILDLQPNRRVVLECDHELVRSLDTIDFEPRPPDEAGCIVRYDADLRPRGLAYLLDLPIHLAFQISGARSARGLERALARLARSEARIPALPDPSSPQSQDDWQLGQT
jgi:hypothetical protein